MVSVINFAFSFKENGSIPYFQYLSADYNGELLSVLGMQIIALFADVKIMPHLLYEKVAQMEEY